MSRLQAAKHLHRHLGVPPSLHHIEDQAICFNLGEVWKAVEASSTQSCPTESELETVFVYSFALVPASTFASTTSTTDQACIPTRLCPEKCCAVVVEATDSQHQRSIGHSPLHEATLLR